MDIIYTAFDNNESTSTLAPHTLDPNLTTTIPPLPSTQHPTTSVPPYTQAPVQEFGHVPLYTLVLASISSIMSILGCAGILWVFIKFQDLRSTSKKLLMYLTIADFFTAAGNLIGVSRYIAYHYEDVDIILDKCDDPGVVCKVQSFITTSSSLMSFLWMMVLSGYFHISVRTGNTTVMAEKFMILFHVLCWLPPVVIVSWAAGLDLLGEDQSLTSGSWCWLTECPHHYQTHTNRMSKVAWMLLSGKLFEIVCYLTLVINYVYVKIILIRRQNRRLVTVGHTPAHWGGDIREDQSESDEYDQETELAERLDPGDVMFIYTPVIMLVLRFWGTLKFLLLVWPGAVYIADHLLSLEVVLTFLQAIGDSGQGWMNFILFCLLTDEVRDRLNNWYHNTDNYQQIQHNSHNESTDASAHRPRRPLRAGAINTTTARQDELTPLLRGRVVYTEPGRARQEAQKLFNNRIKRHNTVT